METGGPTKVSCAGAGLLSEEASARPAVVASAVDLGRPSSPLDDDPVDAPT